MIKCLKSPLLSKYGKKYPRLCSPVQKYYNAQNFIFWLKITFFFKCYSQIQSAEINSQS